MSVRSDQHVVRLEVAMDDRERMEVAERRAQVEAERGDLPRVESVWQGAQQFLGEVGVTAEFADGERADHVRVVDSREQPCLGEEAFPCGPVADEKFQGEFATVGRLADAPHFAERAVAEKGDRGEAVDVVAGLERGVGEKVGLPHRVRGNEIVVEFRVHPGTRPGVSSLLRRGVSSSGRESGRGR